MEKDTSLDWQNNSASLLEAFERDGFVALPGFLNLQEVDELHANLNRFYRRSHAGAAPCACFL